ncbi:MAG TPA: glucose-6-phosphate isomerase, partial [Candidatus Cloacimonas sp.]|nr:glucose-6-phosphate isomerase [Candidatus Cloacimonas sp.]
MIRFDHRNLLANPFLAGAMRPSRVLDYSEKVQDAKAELNIDHKAGTLGFYDLPEQSTQHISSFVQQLDPMFDTMVVLGIGGSALGNKAIYNALKTEAHLKRRVLVYDNVDPVFLHEILGQITLEKTLFNVITKSGGTAETMSAYMILLDLLQRKFP